MSICHLSILRMFARKRHLVQAELLEARWVAMAGEPAARPASLWLRAAAGAEAQLRLVRHRAWFRTGLPGAWGLNGAAGQSVYSYCMLPKHATRGKRAPAGTRPRLLLCLGSAGIVAAALGCKLAEMKAAMRPLLSKVQAVYVSAWGGHARGTSRPTS